MTYDFREILQQSIVLAGPLLWETFSPILIPVILSGAVLFLVKIFAKKIVGWLSIVAGDTKRERRRKKKIIENTIDLISAINDITK